MSKSVTGERVTVISEQKLAFHQTNFSACGQLLAGKNHQVRFVRTSPLVGSINIYTSINHPRKSLARAERSSEGLHFGACLQTRDIILLVMEVVCTIIRQGYIQVCES